MLIKTQFNNTKFLYDEDKNQCCESAPVLFWPLDPGSEICFSWISALGSLAHISESLVTIFGVKCTTIILS